jgi:hypothetical protein
VVTSEAGDSTYMSTDGSMVRLLMKEEPIPACGRLVTGTNYPKLFLAKPQDNSTLKTPPFLRTSITRTISYITAAEVVC